MKQTFVHNVIDPSINELKNTSAFHLMTQINTNILSLSFYLCYLLECQGE